MAAKQKMKNGTSVFRSFRNSRYPIWMISLVLCVYFGCVLAEETDSTPPAPTSTTTPKILPTNATTTTTTPKTTTTAPTTTVKPKPLPNFPKNIGTWFANQTNSSNSCLVLKAAFALDVIVDVKGKNETQRIDVPPVGSGFCQGETAVINISWNVTNSLNLTFTLNETDSKYALTGIHAQLLCHNETRHGESEETLFETSVHQSYRCIKETPVNLKGGIELRIANLQVEALEEPKPWSGGFNSAVSECAADDVSPVVPLAVGISLALLVVVVLIAYLIGRSRSRARGYQSV